MLTDRCNGTHSQLYNLICSYIVTLISTHHLRHIKNRSKLQKILLGEGTNGTYLLYKKKSQIQPTMEEWASPGWVKL